MYFKRKINQEHYRLETKFEKGKHDPVKIIDT